VQQVIRDEDLLARVNQQGEKLTQALTERFGNHPHVGDIRGRGLFIGLELVAERTSKAPFEPQRRIHGGIKQEALERGLICYPMGGTLDGVRGDHVLLAPPFIIEDKHIDELVEKLGQSVDAAISNN